MTSSLLSGLWADLLTDLRNPAIFWQVLVIAASLLIGWGGARILRLRFAPKDLNQRVVRLGMESFSRVLSPVLGLVLIIAARPILAQWQHVNLLRLAIPLVGSFALIRFAFYILRRIFARGGKAGSFLLLFEKSFATLVWGCVALYITGVLPEMIQYLDSTMLPIGRNKVSLLAILQAAVSVVITLIFALWAGALLEERLMRLDTVHSSMRAVMARMGRALLILVAVLVSLSLVGIDLTVLSVFGGAFGVGLGLGLQKIASSYVSGFVILLERSLAIGDMVMVDKYYGKVTQINTRYTVLRGLDGVESVVPNEMLVANPVQNFSLSDRTLRIATQITVEYRPDVEMVLRLLEQAAVGIERVSQTPAPSAALLRFGADGMELELGLWINDPENGKTNVLSNVNLAIWRELQAHHINIPFPQREIRLIENPKA